MNLHARQIAIAAGAHGSMVKTIADRMTSEGEINIERAKEILHKIS
jgi:hydroxymethylglutaryl-CoA reductase